MNAGSKSATSLSLAEVHIEKPRSKENINYSNVSNSFYLKMSGIIISESRFNRWSVGRKYSDDELLKCVDEQINIQKFAL